MLNLALLGAKISQKEQLLRQASLWLAPVRTGSLVSLASRTMPITFSRSTTTTFLDKDGLLKTAGINVPVIEYDANGNCLGLRIWGPVTNLLLRSEDFTAAAWTAFRSTPSANTTTSPNGQVTADRLTEDSSVSNTHGISQAVTIANSTVYTFSVFVKPDGRTRIILGLDIGAGEKKTWFDLSSGTVGTNGNSAASITAYPNGWFRIAATSTSASTVATLVIKLANADGVEVYNGNGVDSISLFGAQLQTGSTLGPYVATTTLAASSTADVMTITGEDFSRIWNPLQGTMFFDGSFVQTGVGGYPRLIAAVGANPGTDEISIYTRIAIGVGDGRFFGNSCVGGSDVFTLGAPNSPKANSGKAAFTFTANNAALYDGEILTTDNTGSLPTVQELRLMGQARFQGQPIGYIREAAIFRNVLPSRSLILLAQ